MNPRIEGDLDIDERWLTAVGAAFSGCATPRDALYTTRVLLQEFLGGVTATLFTASIEGESQIDGETPFGETPDELYDSLRARFAVGP